MKRLIAILLTMSSIMAFAQQLDGASDCPD